MATDSRSLPSFFNVDADFRSWVSGLITQITLGGIVQTSDTGQINTSTVLKPSVINTAQGYGIFRFADTLQSTTPVFIKVEFGSSGAIDRPSLWMTIGNGTDGAGNLTGTVATRRQVGPGVSKTAGGTLPSFCSCDAGRLTLMTNYDVAGGAGGGFAFLTVVERLRDASNNAVADGTVLIGSSQTTATMSSQVMYAGGVTTQLANANTVFAGLHISGNASSIWGGGLSTLGGNVGLMPMLIMMGQPRYLSSCCFYNPADITGGSIITVNNLGANHTYQTLPALQYTGTSTNPGGDAIALLWE